MNDNRIVLNAGKYAEEFWPAAAILLLRGHPRIETKEYWKMMCLRRIWAERSFSVLKREHCLSKIRKRGILAATEECLLSAMTLNLKRMVKFLFLSKYFGDFLDYIF